MFVDFIIYCFIPILIIFGLITIAIKIYELFNIKK